MAAIYKEMYGNEDGTVPATFQVLYLIGMTVRWRCCSTHHSITPSPHHLIPPPPLPITHDHRVEAGSVAAKAREARERPSLH